MIMLVPRRHRRRNVASTLGIAHHASIAPRSIYSPSLYQVSVSAQSNPRSLLCPTPKPTSMGWTFSRFESCLQRYTRPHMRRGEKEIPGCSISDTGNRSGQVNLNSRLFHHITCSFPAAAAHSIRDRKGIYAKHCVLKRNGNAEESFRK